MSRSAWLLMALAACGGGARFRSEHAGNGIALVTPRGAPAAPSAGVPVGRGAYDVRLHFDLPRAQLIEWKVACPGAESEGSAGEPFEAYRNRRLAQLRADREHEAQAAGAVTSLIVGAVAPNVAAQSGPVRAEVSPGDAAGAAVASSVDMNVQLPPGDVGGGPVETVVHLVTTEPGACSVSAVADDPNVGGRFELVHIRDLEAEARSRDVAIDNADVHARAALTTQLVAFGGDLELRKKQREAEAAARARAEAKAGAEAHARVEASVAIERSHEIELHAQADREAHAVFEARMRLRMLLVSWGADVEYRARLRAQGEELEARRLRIAMEARARWRLLLIAWGADLEYRAHLAEREQLAQAELIRKHEMELEVSLRARTAMRAYLVFLGAHERPPMPPNRPETPGDSPFEGAAWIAGHWTWTGVEWSWNAGGWTDRSGTFGATGGEAAVVVETPVVVQPPVIVGTPLPTVIIHTTPTPTIRDHREPVRPSEPVRDHRTPPPSDPKVRDHRN